MPNHQNTVTPDDKDNMTLEEQAAQQEADKNGGGENDNSKILGKFESQEDLEKAYVELEKKLGSSNSEENSETGDESTDEGDDDTNDETDGDQQDNEEEAARKATEAAGVDFDSLSDEYAETGELSEESFKALEEGGISREMAEDYIAGQEARRELMVQAASNTVGGDDALETLFDWANETLPEAEKKQFNNEYTSGDQGRMVTAVKNLNARFKTEGSYDPSVRKNGGKQRGNSTDVYANWAQVKADMSKPEYKSDPAFRAKVEAKLGRSPEV